MIDCCDDYGFWYKSTILRIDTDEEVDIDGNAIKRVQVAFRFRDPNGQKEDEFGRKVTGWIRSTSDENICLSSPKIKKFQSCSTSYQNIGGSHTKYDIDLFDIDDPVYQSKIIQQWTIHRKNFFGNI